MKTTCGVFIINSDKRILITHPTGLSDNKWSIPKGLKESGESEKTAAIREVMEETGIILHDLIEIQGYENYFNGKKRLKSFYFQSQLDLSNIDIYCTSMVCIKNRQPFPENDKHAWTTYKQAKSRLHYTQVKILDSLYSLNLIR